MNILVIVIASSIISATVSYLALLKFIKVLDKMTSEHLDEIRKITIDRL